MNKIKTLLVLLIATIAISFSSSASAQTICKHYYSYDPFEANGSTDGWSPWNNSLYGTISFPTDSQGVSGVGYGKMSLTLFDTASSFVLIDKVFNLTDSAYRWRTSLPQCGNVPWPPPAGNPVNCHADIYIKPVNGASGALEFIDPVSYTYLNIKSFNYAASSQWVNLSTGTVTSCQRNMLVRIALDHAVSGTRSMLFDGLTVGWDYY